MDSLTLLNIPFHLASDFMIHRSSNPSNIQSICRKEQLFLFKKKKDRKSPLHHVPLRKLQLSRGRRNGILRDIRRFARSYGGRMALLLRKNGRDTN